MFFRRKPSLTKEQQDNVVRWLVRSYDPITSVEFTQFIQDKKTGNFILKFELNNDVHYKTGISIKKLDDFDDNTGVLILGPVSQFKALERVQCLSEDLAVDISNIVITYLGDLHGIN